MKVQPDDDGGSDGKPGAEPCRFEENAHRAIIPPSRLVAIAMQPERSLAALVPKALPHSHGDYRLCIRGPTSCIAKVRRYWVSTDEGAVARARELLAEDPTLIGFERWDVQHEVAEESDGVRV